MTNQIGNQNHSTKICNITELGRVIEEEKIFLESLKSLAIDEKGRVELRWTPGLIQKLEEKLSGDVPKSAGFNYLASVQRREDLPVIYVEAEQQAWKNRFFPQLVKTIVETLPIASSRRSRTVYDLHLFVPKESEETMETVKVEGQRVEQLWTGKDAYQLRQPRLASQGLFAAKQGQVMFFPLRGKTIDTRMEMGRTVYTFHETIDYLTRVNPGKGTLVVNMSANLAVALKVSHIADNNAKAEKVSETDTQGYRLIGSPGGDVIGTLLATIARRAPTEFVAWPQPPQHLEQFAAVAF